MQEYMVIASWAVYALLCISVVLQFYLSIKICFWSVEKSKVLLFLLSFLLNPFLALILSSYLSIYVFRPIAESLYISIVRDIPSEFFLELCAAFCNIIILMALLFLCTGIFGKWLGIHKASPLLFLYVMLGAMNIIEETRTVGTGKLFTNPYMRDVIDCISTSIIVVALWCYYFLNVKPFSALTRVNVQVNWKTFIIPPSLFILTYGILGWIIEIGADNEYAVISTYTFSSVIVFLFIWAFNVIVKNIKATNEAITAKNEVKTLSVEVMEALAHTIDAKDEYTRGHSVRVAKYSRMLAQKLELSDEDCENVYYMALLHDIGKIGVPNAIINSPTKLTDEEYAVIKTHPGVGFHILDEIKSRPDLSVGARWHHERFDGKGYPDGKIGEEIPFFARIIAVADTYDAMTSNRSYRNYLPKEVVRSELEKYSGTQFDPMIAKCMIEIMDEDKDYQLHE